MVSGQNGDGSARLAQAAVIYVRGDPLGDALTAGFPDRVLQFCHDVVGLRRPDQRANLDQWSQGEVCTLDQQVGRQVRSCTGLLRVDDSLGQTIDFLLLAKRAAAAAKRLSREAVAQLPLDRRLGKVAKKPDFSRAVEDVTRGSHLGRLLRLPQCKYLKNIVERRIKRLLRPGLDFDSRKAARLTLPGYETLALTDRSQ
jgi:hypothetical protein